MWRPTAILIACMAAYVSPVSANAETQGSVSVSLVGRESELLELARTLTLWEPSLRVTQATQLDASEILDPSGPMGLRIWVVSAPGWGARIYFADPSAKRFLLREVPLSAGLDESGRETIAQVVVTSAEAFVAQRASSSAAEIESSLRSDDVTALRYAHLPPMRGQLALRGTVEVDTVRTQSHSPTWGAQLGGSYAVQFAGSATVHHGPGILVGASNRREAWQWLLALQGQYQFPSTIETAHGTLRLRSLHFGVTTATERAIGRNWSLGGELGLALAYTIFGLTNVSNSTVEPEPQATHLRPRVQVGMRTGYGMGALRFTLRLGSEVALAKTHYDLAERPLYTPWIFAPRVAIDCTWSAQ